MAKNTVILRPSAVVSLGHSKSNSEIEAHLLINEEISDNEATYIFSSISRKDITADSTFNLAGNVLPSNCRLTKIVVHASMEISIASGTSSEAGAKWKYTISNGSESFETNYEEIADSTNGYQHYSVEITDNDFLSNLSDFSNVVLTVETYLNSDSGGSDKSGTSYIYISQLYVEFEYVTGGSIYRKVNNVHKRTIKTYQKTDNTWTEIAEEECKSVLFNNTIRR